MSVRLIESRNCPAIISATIHGKQATVRCDQIGQGRCAMDVLNQYGQKPQITTGACFADGQSPVVTKMPDGTEFSTQVFSPESGLSPLNAYFALPKQDRPHVLDMLKDGAQFLPIALPEGGFNREELEELEGMYMDVVNAYESTLDQNLSPERRKELKGIFYNMIRTLSRPQVAAGAQLIRQIEGSSQ